MRKQAAVGNVFWAGKLTVLTCQSSRGAATFLSVVAIGSWRAPADEPSLRVGAVAEAAIDLRRQLALVDICMISGRSHPFEIETDGGRRRSVLSIWENVWHSFLSQTHSIYLFTFT